MRTFDFDSVPPRVLDRFRYAVTMQIGNPGGILLTVNGRNLGRPGSPGQPVTLSFGPGTKLPSQTSG